MNRAMIFVMLLMFLSTGTLPAAAQPSGNTSYGEGTAADAATTTSVIAFVENFVERMNANDPSIVNVANETGLGFFLTDSYNEALSNVESGMFVEIVLYDIVDVLIHDEGVVSVQVYFSGYVWGWQTTLQTERWYLIPDDAGSFILSDYSFEPLVSIPDSLTTSTVTLTISNDGLELDTAEVASADVIVLEVTNPEANWVSTGIFALPEGTTVADVQARLEADPFNGEGWVGKTPIASGPVEQTFAFIMEPGTYIIQQFALDVTGFEVTGVPQGPARAVVLTVAE